RYARENTKNGQAINSPQAGAASECSPAHTAAEMAASTTGCCTIRASTHRTGDIISVSTTGLYTTMRKNSNSLSSVDTGSPNRGPYFAGALPNAARIPNTRKDNVNEGTKLVSPIRTMYRQADGPGSKNDVISPALWFAEHLIGSRLRNLARLLHSLAFSVRRFDAEIADGENRPILI